MELSRIGPARGGGIRERIRGFSRSSRRNLLRHMAGINRITFRAYMGRVIAVTLTYPGEHPEDPELCKRHLEALRKRLTRRCGKFASLWRMGIQQRGAWHFHLLWYEVCGKAREGHLLAGTYVEEVSTWRKATSYAERYVAKQEEFPEGLKQAGYVASGMKSSSLFSGKR